MDKSKEIFITAKEYIPGGVNSPVRAFKAVGMDPLFIKKTKGSKIYDLDGNSFIDYVCSWGPLILGHAHPQVVQAICQAAELGTSYGAPCEGEVELARMICEAIPSIDKVRMVNSGTEATMSAVRLARAYTGRNAILKFAGCYHGHGDSFLIKAGSGLLTAGVPNSPGVPAAIAEQTLVANYNDIDSVTKIFAQAGSDIAAVIVEPVAGNMGLVLPEPGFLQALREITEQYGALMIFDEVISGFRFCYGGYQNILGITPDLTALGKIIGGGLPVGAYGGKREIMSMIAPEGDVYQAGTLSGNPLAMAAGIASLKLLQAKNFYSSLEITTSRLTNGLKTILADHGLNYQINQSGSLFCLFFTNVQVADYVAVLSCDTEKYAEFFRALLQKGIYFPPSQFELCFVSSAHLPQDIEKTLAEIDKVLDEIY
ncbi:MAG: glutamate-1-semialdehyde 2,1-aminomutase [Syntrophomonadaceae bacterium]|nr:glutamate-1-semialdehyde 2,1-aminomutase [Syntrophomonadaceae bacterium]